MTPSPRIFGIRHHGPGSARSLRAEFDAWKPDCVLIEGPSDASGDIALAGNPDMKPPVALLVYKADDATRAGFFPFAVFSPEWVAIQHALAAGSACRFIDLPQSVSLEMERGEGGEHPDPLGELARAAGHGDGERWWDEAVESLADHPEGIFDALAEAMEAIREDEEPLTLREEAREAHMRQEIRRAAAEGFQRIAVVCGAWHVPALARHAGRGQAARDSATLRGLPKVKTAASWVPWSYEKLANDSGYGAGVVSPEWYHATYEHGGQLAARWLATAAHLLRSQDIDASPASVIQAVRLATMLASMRGRARPTLADMDQATLSALCHANEAPMALIRRKLAIGERIGEVPDDAPATPVQADFAAQAKRLRLKPEAGSRRLELDLRTPLDLDRSRFLNRLGLLGIGWGTRDNKRTGTGTFREMWDLAWDPAFAVALVSASRKGATVEQAASASVVEAAEASSTVADVAALVSDVLDADLPAAARAITRILSDRSALSTDVFDLMKALPPLAQLARYGSVRGPDGQVVKEVVGSIVPRVSAGLPPACGSLDQEAADKAAHLVSGANQAVLLLEDEDLREMWFTALRNLSEGDHAQSKVSGKATRLLYDASDIDTETVAVRLRANFSRATGAADAAFWVEGFLEGSGAVLIHGSTLLPVIDEWLSSLDGERFVEILPLLRRTFATFTPPERHDIGDRIKQGRKVPAVVAAGAVAPMLNASRGERVVPILKLLLGEAV